MTPEAETYREQLRAMLPELRERFGVPRVPAPAPRPEPPGRGPFPAVVRKAPARTG